MSISASNLFDLTGKVALVTGASRGIGAAIAGGLAAFGARVVLASRKEEQVEAAARAIRDRGGVAAALAVNVGDSAALGRLVDRARDLYGGLDIVVNNAAANPIYGLLLDVDDVAFDKILAVNLKAPLELARRAYPLLVERGGGSVINVSSVAGLRPVPNLGLYSASKAALINLTRSLALEWAPARIRVNALCPGLVQTKFSAALWQDAGALRQALARIPLGRIGQPEDLVGLAVFLAGPASGFCTGAVFTADGGETI